MQYELTLMKLANTGAYAWHSFFTDRPFHSFDVGFANGRVVAVGSTERAFRGPAGELPVLPFAVPRPELGDSDVTSGFVVSLELDGTYAWHTFSGPTDSVWLRAIAGDSQG